MGKLGKIGTKWDQVETGGENREKLRLSGTKWKHVGKTEEKLGLSGTKWKQVGKTGKNWAPKWDQVRKQVGKTGKNWD